MLMPKRVTIRHPRYGEPVQRHFAAYGCAQRLEAIYGILRNLDDPTATVLGQPFIHQSGGAWVLAFPEGVDDGSYVLEIREYEDQEILKRVIVTVKHLDKGLTITHPVTNDTVCPAFNAYGTSDQKIAAGTVTVSGMETPGQIVKQWEDDDHPLWIISFPPVGVGNAFLEVDDVGGYTQTRKFMTDMGFCTDQG
jgi:hypothetical protein